MVMDHFGQELLRGMSDSLPGQRADGKLPSLPSSAAKEVELPCAAWTSYRQFDCSGLRLQEKYFLGNAPPVKTFSTYASAQSSHQQGHECIAQHDCVRGRQ